jgi:hypothetical protein
MAWLIVPLALVVLLYVAGFRRSAAALLVAAILAGVLLYYYNERLQEDARSRIPLSDVEVEGVAITPTFRSSYNLSGSVRNKSEQYRLEGITFKVTLRDCQSPDKSKCVSISEATSYVPLNLAPQEAREFIGSLYFGSDETKPKGTLEWDYEIVAITGKRQ